MARSAASLRYLFATIYKTKIEVPQPTKTLYTSKPRGPGSKALSATKPVITIKKTTRKPSTAPFYKRQSKKNKGAFLKTKSGGPAKRVAPSDAFNKVKTTKKKKK